MCAAAPPTASASWRTIPSPRRLRTLPTSGRRCLKPLRTAMYAAQRTAMYAAQRERAGVEQQFQSKEDFFRFLAMEAELETLSELTLGRVAQLTQKTNQFNLTTRRYSEAQIAEMAKQPDRK